MRLPAISRNRVPCRGVFHSLQCYVTRVVALMKFANRPTLWQGRDAAFAITLRMLVRQDLSSMATFL